MTNSSPHQIRMLFVVESGTDVRLINGLARMFDLQVLFRSFPSRREINHKPFKEISSERGPRSRFAFALLVVLRLLSNIKTYDVVLVQGYGLAALACNVVRYLFGIPVIMLVCSPVEAYYRCRLLSDDSPKYRSYELLLLRTVARINAILGQVYVVLSDYLAEVMRGHCARCPIFRIPIYGVDASVFHPLSSFEEKLPLKKSLGLPTTGKIIFFSSRVAPEKDVLTLLEAIRRLRDEGADLWLLHRSGGFKDMIRHAERMKLADRLIATDAVYPGKDLANDYRACDLCVQASREEGLGFSVLEALACGTPVVATEVGGLRETVQSSGSGWTYPRGNVTALASSICLALENAAEASNRACLGRNMVLGKFEQAVVFEQFKQLVNDLLLPVRQNHEENVRSSKGGV